MLLTLCSMAAHLCIAQLIEAVLKLPRILLRMEPPSMLKTRYRNNLKIGLLVRTTVAVLVWKHAFSCGL